MDEFKILDTKFGKLNAKATSDGLFVEFEELVVCGIAHRGWGHLAKYEDLSHFVPHRDEYGRDYTAIKIYRPWMNEATSAAKKAKKAIREEIVRAVNTIDWSSDLRAARQTSLEHACKVADGKVQEARQELEKAIQAYRASVQELEDFHY